MADHNRPYALIGTAVYIDIEKPASMHVTLYEAICSDMKDMKLTFYFVAVVSSCYSQLQGWVHRVWSSGKDDY